MSRKSGVQRGNKQASHEKPTLLSLLPPLFSETFGTEIVQITVGGDESKRTFNVHKNLLVSKSRFFSAMFDSNFLEAVTSSASFPEDDPSAFEVLMEWIYYDSLKSVGLSSRHTQEGAQENMRKIIMTLGLADKYCIDELADRCLTILYHRSRNYVSCRLDLGMIGVIYAATGPVSMARKYAISELAEAVATTSVPARARSISGIITALGISETCKQNRDILDDLFKAITRRSQPPLSGSAVCQFHLHPKAAVCPYAGMDEDLIVPTTGIDETPVIPQKTANTVDVEGQGLDVTIDKQRLEHGVLH
ncbi:hypothetical protein V496_06792 [Pseudogymnoascus sp. VKM F-4515 (FW-2607)]|nr:hypothetical protein V496_06792 [Pseudogymnoascus sp. VKM F-4515 (FW-2607)]KFY87639.1 hypothetical protein V498_07077 [Pseudogymnoascus sp. VKM F-4517 (FW-2822)]